MVEPIDAPPDDGMTIEGDAVDDAAPQDFLPPSKLPAGQQFDVLSGWLRADMDHSREWRGQAKFWFGFRAGEQWTAEDKALLESQQRPVIVFNRVLTILKAVAGMEINGRHEISFLPTNSEDTAVNEVLTAGSKWMSEGCDGEDEESQAFDNTCTCGMGWTEDRMSYEDNPAGMYVEESIDPLEMYWDRTSKKKNLANARRKTRVRRMALGDAVDLFPGFNRSQLDATWAEDGQMDYPQRTLEDRRRRDEDNTMAHYDDLCEVTIVQMQWIEREVYWLVADAATNTKAELTDEQYKRFAERMKVLGMKVEAVRLRRKVYKQAFLGAEGVMLKKAGPAPIKGQFSWKCITGELDAKKGTWFGLVHLLRDPQMWANKWLSQILHILNSTAKGGILAETSAFDDERQAEDSYAHPESITWLADGALSGEKPKIMPKPGGGITEGFLGLLTFAISSFKDVSGINLELLGQQDQNQPGIIEAMRKQAGMTVLATLFDSLRRYRKMVGRSRLYFIQNFLSDGRLIRITGPNSTPQAIRLAKERTTGEYDVIVDDTPTSPNQKEANWAIIQPLLAVFKEQLMAHPEVFAMLLEYSPLPARIVDAIKGFIKQQQENPEAQRKRQIAEQLMIAGETAKIAKDQSVATLNNAKAGGAQADAVYNIAFAKNLLEDNMRQGRFDEMRNYLDTLEASARARKSEVDAEQSGAKTMIGMMDAETRRLKVEGDMGTSRVGMLIDKLAAEAGAVRDFAAAKKDLAIVKRPAPASASK